MTPSSRRTYPERQERHGKRGTPEYAIWLQMKGRCLNPRNKRYQYYGGRGIKLHPTWETSFLAFLQDVGPRPSPAMSLERTDNDGHYAPGNVVWAPRTRQPANRGFCWTLTHGGKTMLATDWAKEVGLPYRALRQRLLTYKWPIERALTTPLGHKKRQPRGRARDRAIRRQGVMAA